MHKNIVLIGLIFISFPSYSQLDCSQKLVVTKKFVDAWILSKDSCFFSDYHTVYVINDCPYDENEVDSILNTWLFSNLLDIKFVKSPGVLFYHRAANLIMISSKEKLNQTSISYGLRSAYKVLFDKCNPLVIVNDVLIKSKDEAIRFLSTIDPKQIYCISVIDEPLHNSLMAQHATNGLIRIWTYR